MIDEPSQTRARQKSRRSLFLLVILGISVAGAWYLSRHLSAGTREASEILAEIRTRGLSSFWTAEEGEKQWFFIRKEGKNVGWEFTYRKPVASGGYEGGMVSVRGAPTAPPNYKALSRWTLSNDISQGKYAADEISLRPVGGVFLQQHKVATRTELENAQLSVRQRFDSVVINSSATTPENYLPEGAHSFVLQQVAQRKTSAIFAGIIDSERPDQGRVRFATLIFEYIGQAEENPQLSVLRIKQKLPNRSSSELFYYLDPAGRLVKRTGGAIEFRAVTREEILAIYPLAESHLRGLPE